MIGGMFPIIHLGRAWFFYYLIPYPNQRLLWPNFRSPLVWDLTAIFTYLTGSLIYLYLPLIPDMAARRAQHAWRRRLSRAVARLDRRRPRMARPRARHEADGRYHSPSPFRCTRARGFRGHRAHLAGFIFDRTSWWARFSAGSPRS
jgi:hypothetical protein